MPNEPARRTLRAWRVDVFSETQEEWAKRLGVSVSIVYWWERDIDPKVPRLKMRRQVAAKLGLRVDQIIWPAASAEEKEAA